MDAIIILGAVVAAAWAAIRIGRSAAGVFHANRLRARELERTVLLPEPGRGGDPSLTQLHAADVAAAGALREDYALTGALVAAAGVGAMFAGRSAGYGTWAVGLYTGGTVAIVVGLGLAIFGSVLRILARPILDSRPGSRNSSRQ